jgi:hypothetical protein
VKGKIMVDGGRKELAQDSDSVTPKDNSGYHDSYPDPGQPVTQYQHPAEAED